MKSNCFASALGLVLVCGTANAVATLTFVNDRAEARARYFLPSGGIPGNVGAQTDGTGVDFNPVENRSFTGGGFSGNGYAELGVHYIGPSPLIGGDFDGAVLEACTSAEIFTGNTITHRIEEAYGLASGLFQFNLATPVNWSWIGGWQGTSFNTLNFNRVRGVMTLIDLGTGIPIVNMTETSINGTGNWAYTFSLSGTIGPGSYEVAWLHESLVTAGQTQFGFFANSSGGGPLVSCIPSTFLMIPIPSTGTVALAGTALFTAGLRRRR